MANLVQLSNDLESVPKEQLIQMSQDPNSTYPSYLVLAEIQRRTQMEKMYAAQQPKPQTTVAEEVVSEFASSPSVRLRCTICSASTAVSFCFSSKRVPL